MERTEPMTKCYNFKTIKTLDKHLADLEPRALSIAYNVVDEYVDLALASEPNILYFENKIAITFKLEPEQANIYNFLRTDPNGLFAQKDEVSWLVELDQPTFKLEELDDNISVLTIKQGTLTYYMLLQPKRNHGFGISYFENLKTMTPEFAYLLNLGLLGKIQSYNLVLNEGTVVSSYSPVGTDKVFLKMLNNDETYYKENLDLVTVTQGLSMKLKNISSIKLERLDINTNPSVSLLKYIYGLTIETNGALVDLTISAL